RVIEGPEMIEVTNAKVVVAKENLKKLVLVRRVIRFSIKGKFSPRFIGPFEILDRVGEVSYRLALPPQLSHVHNVFHVSLLRGYKYHPLHVISYPLDQIRIDLSYVEEPDAIFDRQDRVMRKKTILSSRFFGGTIPSEKPLRKPRSLSGLLILISFHDL
nr:putative reverse transcriptase domain-containing protein [Tanacetum cinerariifolium]